MVRFIVPVAHKFWPNAAKLLPGEAVITSGGNLPAKYVIHTVGPVWRVGNNNEPQFLKNAYFNSLRLAVASDCETIAFPNISTGVYGFPKELAAKIAFHTVTDFLDKTDQIRQVYFVCFDQENYDWYASLLSAI